MHALARETMNAASALYRCNLCEDRRQLFSQTLNRFIKCPGCMRKARKDPSGLRALTQVEKDRRAILEARRLAATLRLVERVASRSDGLTPLRGPVSRVMERWAVGEGSGLPYTSDELDMAAKLASEQADTFTPPPARPPALDDETQVVIDRVVLHLPQKPWDMRLLVRNWYVSPIPVRVIAEEFDVSRAQIYRHWYSALDYLRAKFETASNATLLRLIRTVM